MIIFALFSPFRCFFTRRHDIHEICRRYTVRQRAKMRDARDALCLRFADADTL